LSALPGARARARAFPAALWLAGIVLLSVAVRIALARRIVAPWIMVDEIVYSELAKSFAAHGQFLVRGVPSRGYGIVYPVLIAPAWRLFGAVPSVYVAAKTINSVLMSLAAIPAYFLARRLLPAGLSLAVAGLSVLVPEMLYTGMMMTENAFYPIFVAFCLLLVLTLEAPTARRQIGLLALFALAYETRAQAVALLPALATAPVLLAALQREPLAKGLRRFATLYAILGAGVVVALAATSARGRSPLTLLGAYDAATSSTYTVGGVARFILYHLAGLDLYLGVIPFAALLAIWFSPRAGSPARTAFAVGSFSISLWLIPEVAAFASQTSVDRIEERNMFYLAPFALVALLALAREGLVPRRGRAVVAAAALAGVLPFFIPFTSFINTSAVSDTFVLLPWWWVQDHWITLQQVRYAALGVALAGGAAFLLLPRRFAPLLALLVGAYFVATTAVVDNGRHGIHLTSVGSLYSGTHETHPDWIDRAVGAHASVVVLWDGTPTLTYTVWEEEFFNRSVGAVYDLDGAWDPDPLPELAATRSQSGVLLSGGRPIEARYVLAHGSLALAGRLVAADPVGIDLYRVDGQIVVLTHIAGLYPNDTWSVGGAPVSYQRVECAGGSLAVTLESDAQLFGSSQTVVAYEAGRVVGVAHVPRIGERVLTVPLSRGAGGSCRVRFAVALSAVPARVERGSSDTRPLGVHFLDFRYFR
jgi:hypothetical protein